MIGFYSAVVPAGHDPVPGRGVGAVAEPDDGAVADDAPPDQVLADPAGQLGGQGLGPGHQQGVLAVEPVVQVGAGRVLQHVLALADVQPVVLPVVGEHGHVAVAQPQRGLAFPGVGEPAGLAELDVAEVAGQQGHAAAALDGLQLHRVPGHDDLGAVHGGAAQDGGQVGDGGHGGFVEGDQGARGQVDGGAGLAGVFGVAEPFGGVVAGQAGDAVPGGFLAQHVAGVAGGGQRDHRPDPGLLPGAGHLDRGAGLAGPGRADHHLGPPRRGQQVPGGGSLIHPQPASCRSGRRRGVRRGLEVRLEPLHVRAEQPRRRLGVQVRRAGFLRLRQEPFLEGELRLAGVAFGAVRPEHRFAVRAAQPVGDARPFRRGQQLHPLPGRAGERTGGEGLQRGAVGHRPGRERLSQVADQVGLGPRRYPRLGDRDRLGHHVPRLILAQTASRSRVRHRPRPLPRRCGRRAGAGLRPGDLAPELILRLCVGALLRFPALEEQRGLDRPGIGAVEGDKAGEPLDAPELVRVRGAAVLAGELPPDRPGHSQHGLGRRVPLGLLNRAFAGLPGRLGDRAGDGRQFSQVLLPRCLLPFPQLGADIQRRFGFAGPGAVGDVFLDPVHLPGVGPPPGLQLPARRPPCGPRG